MSCFKPLTAWRGDVLPSGKRSVVFKAGEAPPGLVSFPQKLPCGQCYGCRLDYSYDWAVRCVCESQMHKANSLVLLTYEKVPDNGSLRLEDWRHFMRMVRRKYGSVRFFHAGEYGSKNGRPHDHALLFGLDFPDKKFFKMSAAGYPLYLSDSLQSLWSKGHTTVGEVSFESAGYLARYLMEKPTITEQVKNEDGIVIGRRYTKWAEKKYGTYVDKDTGERKLLRRPEGLTMSRNPGIGESWLRKYYRDIYPHDYMVLKSGAKMPPPRYFDNKVEKWGVVDMKTIKLHRIGRCQKTEDVWSDFLQKMQVLDVNRDDRLAVMEVCKRAEVELYGSERGAYL